jgi:hypothetical protein
MYNYRDTYREPGVIKTSKQQTKKEKNEIVLTKYECDDIFLVTLTHSFE